MYNPKVRERSIPILHRLGSHAVGRGHTSSPRRSNATSKAKADRAWPRRGPGDGKVVQLHGEDRQAA